MLALLLMPAALKAQTTVTVGNGTSTWPYAPFSASWEYSFVEQLYTADEIGYAQGGLVTSIGFNMSTNTSQTNHITVYMKNVSRSEFSGSSTGSSDWEPVAAYNIVYEGDYTFHQGWNTIPLDVPFMYDGTSNLMVAMHENTFGNSSVTFYSTTKNNSIIRYVSDTSDPDPYSLGSGEVYGYRANLQLTFAQDNQTVVIGQGTAYTTFTPYASEYYYSLVEQLYTASEIGVSEGGLITSVSFNMYSSESQTNHITLYLKNTSKSTFSSATDWVPVTADDIVYEGNFTFVHGWNTIIFTTPFQYDGTSNLMVAMHEDTYGFQARQFYYTSKSNSILRYRSDETDVDPANLNTTAGVRSSYRSNIKLSFAASGNQMTIGDGTSTTYGSPYNSFYTYSFVEQIYTAEEIGVDEGGMITSIGFNMSTNTSQTNHITVYMRNVYKSEFYDDSDYLSVSTSNIVYEGDYTFKHGWNTITLDEPFLYDGTRNLMVAIHENTPAWETRYFYHTVKSNSVLMYYSDTEDPDPFNLSSYGGSSVRASYRANIRLGIQPYSVAIGEGTGNSGYLPSNANYRYSLTEQIYTPAEIGGAGGIQSISFFNDGSTKTRAFDIYLRHTSKSSFSSTSDYVNVTEADRVFRGVVTMTKDQWTTIHFDVPFPYDGSQNLLLVVDDNSGYYNGSWSCRTFTTSDYQAIYHYSDNTNYNPLGISGAFDGRLTKKNQILLDLAPAEHVTLGPGEIIDFEPGDFSQHTFYNDGTYPWTVVTADNGSSYCMKSGNGGVHNSSSTIWTSAYFAEAGHIQFDAKCMGEGTSTIFDKCLFYIDGVQQFSHGADVSGWQTYIFPVTAGNHTFTWKYTKNGTTHKPGDAFFVDNIMFYKGEPCEAVHDLTVSELTLNSALLTWEGSSASYTINYQYMSETVPPVLLNVNVDSFRLGLLNPGDYYVSVRANCSPAHAETAQFTITEVQSTANWYSYVPTSLGDSPEYKFISFNMQDPATVTPSTDELYARGGYSYTYAAAYLNGYVWCVTYDGLLTRAPLYNNTRTIGEFETLAEGFESGRAISMSYNPVDRMFYYIAWDGSSYKLMRFDPEQRTAPTEVGTLSNMLLTLAINPAGVAYGIETETGDLYRVNLSNASLTFMGNTGMADVSYVQDMAFDMETGELFWAQVGDYGLGLYKVDPATATCWFLGQIGGGDGAEITGLFMGSSVFDIIDFETNDFSQYTFANDATYPWTVVAADNGSSYCMKSGNAGHHSTSSSISVSRTYAEDGSISFDAKCMGEGTSNLFDKCLFYIDGEEQFRHGADVSGWQNYVFPVTAGTHSFTWTYTKNHSVHPTDDAFFVDNIVFGNEPPCVAPNSLAVNIPAPNTAIVSWNGMSSEYTLRYRVMSGTPFFDDFESGLNGWTVVDADGDGFQWELHHNTGTLNHTTHSGDNCIISGSYDATSGALTPDNWLITPHILLGNEVSFWAVGQDASYADEHFAVYVSTTGNNPSDFIQVSPEFVATGSYMKYTADLSAYSGQLGYVAIRHYNVTDMFYLNVDDFSVSVSAISEWVTETVTGLTDTLNGITAGIYEVEVIADCNDWLPESTTFTITCDSPWYTDVVDVGPHSATVFWIPYGEATTWQLCLNDDESNLITVTDTFYTFTDLTPETYYEVKVRSFCNEYAQSYWQWNAFTTLEACPAPYDLAASEIGPNSADVSWSDYGDDADLSYALVHERQLQYEDTYDYNYYTGQSTSEWALMFPADQLGHLHKLTKVSIYESSAFNTEPITVKIYSGGSVAPGNTLLYTTTVSPMGTDGFHEVMLATPLTIDPTQNLWISLTEDGASCPAVSEPFSYTQMSDYSWYYNGAQWERIYYNNWMISATVTDGTSTPTTWVTVPGVTSPYTLSGLNSSVLYEVKVQSDCGTDGISVMSEPLYFSTTVSCPPPTDITVSDIGYYSAVIDWLGFGENYSISYRTSDVLFFEDFENGLPAGWTTIDADGDGYNWFAYNPEDHGESNADVFGNPTVMGTTCMSSLSYYGYVGLTPDNWLITPRIDLQGTLKVWLREYWGVNFSEHFAIYLSTTGTDISDFTTTLIDTTVSPFAYTEYTADLSAYAGQKGYIAIRHFDCYDQYRLQVDNFAIYGGTSGEWQTVNDVNPPYTLSGLDPGTVYEMVIWSSCDSEGLSNLSSEKLFTTKALFDTIDFETADFSQYTFVYDATYPWVVVAADNGSGYCMRSGNQGVPNSSSTMEASYTFDTDGYILFDAKCMGEKVDYDVCVFYIDGVEQFSQDVEGWHRYAFPVTAGNHTFKWIYSKDNEDDPMGDAFFVDNIFFGEGPFCLPITEINTALSTNAATVSWDGYSDSYTLRYRSVGGEWSTVPGITDMYYTITGLTPGDYEVELALSCDEGNWTASTFTIMEVLSTAEWYGYAIDFASGQPWEDQFIHFNMQTPATVTQATSGLTDYYTYDATYANGYVWCVTMDGDLTKASLDNENHTISAFDTVVANFENSNAVFSSSYNPVDGKIYIISYDDVTYANYLKSFDPADPEHTLTTIGAFNLSSASSVPIAIAINQNGEAYCLDLGGQLYHINLSNASLSDVGPTGVLAFQVQGFAFDMETGELFWSQRAYDDVNLYKVDPATAAVMCIGQVGGGAQVVGLFMGGEPCTAPEDLTVSHFTNTSATASWTGTADSYTLRYKPVSGDWITVTDITDTFYLIDGLTPGDYEVEVAASCDETNTISATFNIMEVLSTANWYTYSNRTTISQSWNTHFINFSMQDVATVTAASESLLDASTSYARAATYVDGYVWCITKSGNLTKAKLDNQNQTISSFETVVSGFDTSGVYSMTYNPTDGRIYYLAYNSLLSYSYMLKSFNPEQPDDVLTLGFLGGGVNRIAINNAGEAYGTRGVSLDLLQIDLTTLSCTLVGNMGIKSLSGREMAFDKETGELFLISCGGDYGVYKVNLETAKVQSLGALGNASSFSVAGLFMGSDYCFAPEDLTVSNITTDGATLSWQSDATSWDILLDGATLSGVTNNPYVFTGFLPGTEHTVKVRAHCEGIGESNWSDSLTFTTNPSIIPSYVTITGTTAVCPGSTTVLTVTTDVEATYLWSTGATNASVTVGAGEYSVTVTSTTGDELSETITVEELPTYNVTDEATICQSELPYAWNGVTFTEAGTQTATLQTVNGCDSVVTMTLTVNLTYNATDDATICQSALPYEWNGVTFNAAGTQTATLTATNGCDSVVTMTLTVNPTYNVTDEATICQSALPYAWNGVTFSEAGTQTATLIADNGCDSVVTMTLTVNLTYNATDEATICQSVLPYAWNGVTFTEAGTQTATLTAANGCDSVVTMTLTVNPTYNVTDEATICQSALPYEWNGVTFSEAGTQTVTLQTVNGCDSVVTMTLTVNQVYAVTDTREVCPVAMPYEWNGVTFSEAGTQTVTLQSVHGCDSVVTMTLTVNAAYNITDNQTICVTQLPYTWNDVTFTEAGTQSVTLEASNGCDSVVTMTLTVNPTYNVTDDTTICQSALPYEWNGVTFTEAGTQTATMQTVNGCDSVVTMTLTVNEVYSETDTKTICFSALPYEWNGVTFNEAGTQTATLTAANGCDSVVTMTLTVNNVYHVSDAREVCESSLPYEWNGVTFTEAGTQTTTLPTVNGCDSTVTMTLTVYPTYNLTDEATICASELPYEWNGVTFTEAGTQTATLEATNGCDSVVTMTLTVNPTYNVTDEATICQSELPYEWNGVTFTEAGTQNATLTTVNGCDSVVAMTLTVNPAFAITESHAVCVTQLPYEWNGVTFTAAGTQTATLQAVNGCDSVVTMTLTVNYPQMVSVSDTICQSELPYEWNGVTFTAAGSQLVTLPATNGCDSMITMTLMVNPTYNETEEAAICESELPYEWNGVTFTEAGTQTVTLQTVNGCDSVVTLHLTVNPVYALTDSREVCPAAMPYDWSGVIFTEAGTQTVTLQTVNGCDSVVTMTLAVNAVYNITDNQTICASELPYTWNDVTFTEAGTQTVTLAASNGCDSVVTMILTVNSSTTGDTTAVACDSFTWYGNTYTESGDYEYTMTNAAGCDSVVTLHLTINSSTIGDTTAVACNSFTWNGTAYTESGDYTSYLTNAAGCDSVVTLHLTINSSTIGDTTAVACNSFTWYDSTYTVSGDYTSYLTNAAGCDSVVTLHLTVNYSTAGDTTAVACDSFTWYGETYTESGDYTSYLPNAAGCDSVVTLHLMLNYAETAEIAETVCDSFTWYGETYTESGDYTSYLTNASGCDSVVTLHLTINSTTTGDTTAVACDSFTWYDSTYTVSGDYTSYLTNANGCDSVVTLHLTVNYADTSEFAEVACDSYEWNDSIYTESGDYTSYLTNAAGCDSVVTLHLTINNSTTGDTTAVACESFTWYGNTYTESGDYTSYLTTAAGCDSVVTLHLTINNSTTGIDEVVACDSYTWIDGNTYTASTNEPTFTLTNVAGCDSVVTLHLTVNYPVTAEFTVETSDSCYDWNGVLYCASGDYTQTLTAANGCDSVVTLHLTTSVGVENHEAAVLYLAPNPTKNVSRIYGVGESLKSVEVFDMRGRLITKVYDNEIDVTTLPTGVYLVKVYTDKGVTNLKLVRQ